MQVIAGTRPETSLGSRALVLGVFGLLGLTALSPLPLVFVVPAISGLMVLAAFHRQLLDWKVLLSALVVVILFIPIRRYTLGLGAGGFQIEPYRVLVGVILLGWAVALLVDRRVRLRATGLEAPMLLIALSILWSIAWNAEDIVLWGIAPHVVKTLSFFAGYFMVFYVIVTVVKPAQVRSLVKLLVAGGALVAVSAVFEGQTGTNLFDKLGDVVPLLQENVLPNAEVDVNGFNRGDRLRTYASAEHPIALAAALAMLLPMAIALAITGSRWWWLASLPIGMGTLATLSRTGVLMLVVIGVVFLWLRPRKTLRMWWAIIPLVVATNVLMPHTLGILKSSFFPAGGLIAEQQSSAGSETAGGRATDFAPVLARVNERPLFGVGFATTVVPVPGQPVEESVGVATPPTTRILDNQWLGTLLVTGIVGVFAWLWLFWRFARRLGRAAKADDTDEDEGWLLVGIVAAITANAVGMFTYDAFAFVQATFIMFILMAFGVILGRGALVRRPRRSAAEPVS